KPLPTNEVVPTKPVTPPVSAVETAGVTTHEVKAKESLYSISKKYKVSIDELKAWNQLTDNGIKIGQQLIVAKPGTEVTVVTPVATPVTKPIVAPIEKDPMPNVVEKAAPQETLPTAKPQPAVTTPVKTVPAEAPVKITKPADNNQNTTVNNPPVIFQNSKQIIEAEGFFAAYFDKTSQTNNLNGDAGIFKSISGWGDKKYYVLINSIEPGSIVRVSANGKSICARVLNSLPNLKEDASLLLRLNNAAASALGLAETGKWPVTVQY
ncbi:MAG: LysM peptidoglycan-binding domain-containing protein, partial [Chitinophagaceae bacterium]